MPIADPTWTRLAATATSWLLTYAVHSTLLLGGAWLVSRRLGGRRLAVQETLWKLALVGGLATATLQLGLGVRPLGGAWALDLGAGDPDGLPMTTAATTPMPTSANLAAGPSAMAPTALAAQRASARVVAAGAGGSRSP